MSASKIGSAMARELAVPLWPKNGLACEPSGVDSDSKSAVETQIKHATAQDLLDAWDCDLWQLSHSPINCGLKPLTPEELEALVTRFPDVMHIYVKPDVAFQTAASEAPLLVMLRRDLVVSVEVQIQVHVRGGIEISEYCGGKKSAAYVLAFNTLRVKAILQMLAAESHRS